MNLRQFNCANCGTLKFTKQLNAKFCSRSCFYIDFNHKRKTLRTKCPICHKEVARKSQKLCSIECRTKYLTKIYKGRTLNTGKTHFKKGRLPLTFKGIQYTESGYRKIYSPSHPFKDKDQYVREHRLVVEKHIGRYLNPSEVIHHVNQDKLDNKYENLQILTNKEHSKLHATRRYHG